MAVMLRAMSPPPEQGELFEELAPLAPPPDLSGAYDLGRRKLPAAASPPARQLPLIGPETAQDASRGRVPPAPAAAAGRATRDSWPIPARCPVTGGRTCHRTDCRHFRRIGDGRCAHPQAAARPKRRR